MKKAAMIVALAGGLMTSQMANAEVDKIDIDSHYTPAGFFDMHVCNWPEKGVFYMSVFSSVKYDNVKQVEIFDAKDQRLGEVDWTRFRDHPKQKGKRIYITHLPMLEQAKDGWFTSRIHMKDGSTILSKDYLIHGAMAFADKLEPFDQSVLAEPPKEFKWTPPAGSTHWVVTIRDAWDNDAVVYTSGALTEPVLKIPDGVLKKGGAYSWRVHSRDGNGNILLGDFNHGSMSRVTHFNVGS